MNICAAQKLLRITLNWIEKFSKKSKRDRSRRRFKMMGCNYSTNMPLIGFLFSGGILPLIFLSLIIFTIIFLIRTISRNNNRQHNSIASDRSDSLEILKVRYAKGEIDSEKFNKMRQVLL